MRVRVMVSVAIAAVALIAAGCGGNAADDAAPTPTVAAPIPTGSPAGAATQLDAAAFRDAIAAGDAFVVNVHIPYEGELPGTDAFVPYNAIEQDAGELPEDKATTLYVYCRSGRMSAQAIPALQRLGYSNIVELRGGMDAWREAGFAIETATPGS
jgi:rhodanese-related sulfurtransferase